MLDAVVKEVKTWKTNYHSLHLHQSMSSDSSHRNVVTLVAEASFRALNFHKETKLTSYIMHERVSD